MTRNTKQKIINGSVIVIATIFITIAMFIFFCGGKFGPERMTFAGALVAAAAAMITIWAAQTRAMNQQEREDIRNARTINLQQRNNLVQRFDAALANSSADNKSVKKSLISEFFSQIDDWDFLTQSEAALEQDPESAKSIKAQGNRRKQSVFDAAYSTMDHTDDSVSIFVKSLRDRLSREEPRSTLSGINFSNLRIGTGEYYPLSEWDDDWEYDHPDPDRTPADLSNLKFPSGTHFKDTNLSVADLRESNIENASFEKALLSDAQLQGAKITHSNLSFARLELANLHKTVLKNCDLTRTNFYGADLRGTDLETCFIAAPTEDIPNPLGYFNSATYDEATKLPGWLNPDDAEMIYKPDR